MAVLKRDQQVITGGDTITKSGRTYTVIRGTFVEKVDADPEGSWEVVDEPYTPPAAPEHGIWENKKPMRPDRFPFFFSQVCGAAKWAAIQSNAKTAFIKDVVMAPTQREIDPNDKNGAFKAIVAYLRGLGAWGVNAALQSPTDDEIMLTEQQEQALAASWDLAAG